MSVINHEHKVQRIEGRLLSPQELIERGLTGFWHISGRCTLDGCSFVEVTSLNFEPLKSRKSRLTSRTK